VAYGIRVEVWGEYGCFTRPELSVERFSYDCITPSAAVGMLEGIWWHPGMAYRIDRIHVLNPIQFTTIRRNELKSKASASTIRSSVSGKGALPYINTKRDIQQRTSTILVDVRYVIEAHFDLVPDEMGERDNTGKFSALIQRRLERGACFHTPYLGTREFPASFRSYEGELPARGYYSDSGERDLGLMLYGMDYTDPQDITPMFYRAVMRDGVIDVAGSEVYR